MDSRLVVPAREELHSVTCVDDQRVWDVFDELPDAIGGEDLERGDGLRPKNGNRAEVCVALEPDIGRLALFFVGARVAISGRLSDVSC